MWVACGGMVAGMGLVLPHAWGVFWEDGVMILLGATLLLGFGQALLIPTQLSFLMQISDREVNMYGAGPVLGVFRFLERLGSFAGPLIAGCLLLSLSPGMALMWMGLSSVVLSALGLSLFMAIGQVDEQEAMHALLVKA